MAGSSRIIISTFLIFLMPERFYASNSCFSLFTNALEKTSETQYQLAEELFRKAYVCYVNSDSINQAFLSLSYIVDCQEKQSDYTGMTSSLKLFRLQLFRQQFSLEKRDFYNRYLSLALLEGILMSRIGNLDSSMQIYKEASDFIYQRLQSHPSADDSMRYAKSLYFLGNSQYDAGDYQRSTETLERGLLIALPLIRHYGYSGFYINFYLLLSKAYEKLNNTRLATHNLDEASDFLSSLDERFTESKFKVNLAMFEYLFDQDSIYQAQTPLIALESLSNSPDYYAKYLLLNGRFLVKRSDPSRALESLTKAEAELKKQQGEFSLDVAGCRLEIAKLYVGIGNLEMAMHFAGSALESMTRQEGPPGSVIGNREEVLVNSLSLEILLSIGNISWLRYQKGNEISDIRSAWDVSQKSMHLLEELRLKISLADERARILESSKELFELAIRSAYALFEFTCQPAYIDSVFHCIERSKSLNLREALAHNWITRQAGIPDSLVLKERILRTEVEEKEKLLRDRMSRQPGDIDAIQQLYADLSISREKFDEHLDHYALHFPAYTPLEKLHTIPSVFQLQKSLAPDEAILEYFEGTGELFCLVIEPDSIYLYRTVLDFPLREWILELIRAVRNFPLHYNEEDLMLYARRAQGLYQKLFPPLIESKKLLIIPDGSLHRVIFESLLTSMPGDISKPAGYPYLLWDHSIGYHYSVTLLKKEALEKRDAAIARVLAVAPDFKEIAPEEHPYRLKYNLPEASAVVELVGGQLLRSAAATKERFLSESQSKVRNYTIAHLATHGWMDQESGEDSYIEFAPLSEEEEGRLFAFDLYSQSLPFELVFLSSCETGYGELQGSEGMISIGRAFFYAGVNAIVASHWPVNDRHSLKIVEGFYRELTDGESINVAMTKAKRAYLGKLSAEEALYAHPVYWAGFIVLGQDLRFIPQAGIRTEIPVLTVLLALGAVVIFIIAFRKFVFLKKNLRIR